MLISRNAVMALLILTAVLAGCSRNGLAPLSRELAGYGYTLYKPPRTDRGPGWTFRFIRTIEGNSLPMTLCENLYPGVQLHPGKLKLAKFDSTSTVTVDIAIDFLQKLLKDVASAKANLKRVRAVTISWDKVESRELASELMFDKAGRVVPISSQCRAALEDLKKKHEFENSVFVIQSAALAHRLRYEFKADTESGWGATGQLKALLGFKAGLDIREVDTTTLEINEPAYIGYVAIALRDMVPTGLLGSETATVSGHLLSAEELKTVLGE